MVKKIVSVVLVSVLLSLSLSGCGVVKSFFTYWDGMTKSETIRYLQAELKEKYGEEFSVKKLSTRGGSSWNAPPVLLADCSPAADEDIVFEIEVYVCGKDGDSTRWLYDNYIQNVVRKQLKQEIDEVLQENYDSFASEVFVTPSKRFYNSGLSSASGMVIKNFSETFENNENYNEDEIVNKTHIWIVLDKKFLNSIEILKDTVQDMTSSFYSLYVIIDVYFADQEIIDLCNEKVNEKTTDHYQVMNITAHGDFRRDLFIYDINADGLTYVGCNRD